MKELQSLKTRAYDGRPELANNVAAFEYLKGKKTLQAQKQPQKELMNNYAALRIMHVEMHTLPFKVHRVSSFRPT